MALTTIAVNILLQDSFGVPRANAPVSATLTVIDVDTLEGIVVPEQVNDVTGPDGTAVLYCWPNSLGRNSSEYLFNLDGNLYGPFFINHLDANGLPITSVNLRDLSTDGTIIEPDVDARLTALETSDSSQQAAVDDHEVRIAANETGQATQNGRLDALDISQATQDGRLDALEAAGPGTGDPAKDAEQDGRLDTLETGQSAQDARLDQLEADPGGDPVKNAEQDGRLDVLETNDTTQDGRLDALDTGQSDQDVRITDEETKSGDFETRIAALETAPGASAEPDFWYLLPLAGQSNCVGYGEAPFEPYYDNISTWDDNRIKQLGRYVPDNWTTREITADSYNAITDASQCLDHVQFMRASHHASIPDNDPHGGTVGAGLYIARMLLKHLPPNAGILLLPQARGGAAFTAGTVGTYDPATGASNNAQRWGINRPLYQDMIDRTIFALSQNPDNRLLAVVWLQGEMDQNNPTGHKPLFVEQLEQYRADLEAAGLGDQLPPESEGGIKWFCGSSTIWQLDTANRMAVYQNYADLEEERDDVHYIKLYEMPDGGLVRTNANTGDGRTSSTRKIHFGSEALRHNVAKLLAEAITAYCVLPETATVNNEVIMSMAYDGADLQVTRIKTGSNQTRTFDIGDTVSDLAVQVEFSTGAIDTPVNNGLWATRNTPPIITDPDLQIPVLSVNTTTVNRFFVDHDNGVDGDPNGAYNITKLALIKPIFSGGQTNYNFMSGLKNVFWYVGGSDVSDVIQTSFQWGGGTSTIYTLPESHDQKWILLIATCDNSTVGQCTERIYINGIQVAEFVYSANRQCDKSFSTVYDGKQLPFIGSIAEYRYYDRALRNVEVRRLAQEIEDTYNYLQFSVATV